MANESNNCASVGIYDSLRFCQGKSVLPGIRQLVYAIPKRDILAWPTLPAVEGASDMSTLATYDGDFSLKADAKWLCIDLTLNKGNIEYETQGEKPSRTFLNKLTVTHPGNSAESLAFARQAIADDMVFAVPQRDGRYRILGNEMFETDIKPKGSTGEGVTGETSSDLEIEVTDVCPAPFYPGKLETADDGDISGATGKPIVTPNP